MIPGRVIGTLLLIGAQAAAAQAPAEPGVHRFSVRADVSLADPINALIGKIAEPTETLLPPDITPKALLSKLCGKRAPTTFATVERESNGTVRTYVRYQPCLRETPGVEVLVRPNDSLEAIAVRLGMRPSSKNVLKVAHGSVVSTIRPGTTLRLGDRVVAPRAPDWTSFDTRQPTIKGRDDLVALIAHAIGCGSERPDSCLAKRSVLVLEETSDRRNQVGVPPAGRSQPPPPPPPPGLRGGFEALPLRLGRTVAPRSLASALLRRAAMAQPGPPPAPSGPPLPPPLLTAATAPVDPSQWPYDADLVARILINAAAIESLAPDIRIGLPDDGLGDKYGRPLPIGAFPATTRDWPADDGKDEDKNGYVDDWIGAGVLRNADELMPTGDVSLCPTSGQGYATLPKEVLVRMSHGAIVASLAAGTKLRADAQVAGLLPKLLFYRMARFACAATDDDSSGGKEAISAVEYLIRRKATVLSLSFFTNGPEGLALRDRLKEMMTYYPPLLVMPAGDYIASDLDQTGDCPACLGDPTRYSDQARLTLVVGAAGRDRRIADYSGYGVQTVKMYAPGEPVGSLDLNGQPADGDLAATSYAVPQVSFAAALIQALGIRDVTMVRNRLRLSVWPLHPDDRDKQDGSTGILDLVKAVAVRHHAVEVVQQGPSGSLVRHTYVGKITGGLDGVCPGQMLSEAAVQAIRFGEPGADGYLQELVTYRAMDSTTHDLRTDSFRCRPTGVLQMDALRDGHQDLNLANVRLILFTGDYS